MKKKDSKSIPLSNDLQKRLDELGRAAGEFIAKKTEKPKPKKKPGK